MIGRILFVFLHSHKHESKVLCREKSLYSHKNVYNQYNLEKKTYLKFFLNFN